MGTPFARVAAQHEIPLTSVLQGYRISQAVAVDQLLDHADEVGAPTELVCQAVRNLFLYMDKLVALGSRAYVDERRRINSRPERAKYLRVKAVLDGAGDLGMPYPLDGSACRDRAALTAALGDACSGGRGGRPGAAAGDRIA